MPGLRLRRLCPIKVLRGHPHCQQFHHLAQVSLVDRLEASAALEGRQEAARWSALRRHQLHGRRSRQCRLSYQGRARRDLLLEARLLVQATLPCRRLLQELTPAPPPHKSRQALATQLSRKSLRRAHLQPKVGLPASQLEGYLLEAWPPARLHQHIGLRVTLGRRQLRGRPRPACTAPPPVPLLLEARMAALRPSLGLALPLHSAVLLQRWGGPPASRWQWTRLPGHRTLAALVLLPMLVLRALVLACPRVVLRKQLQSAQP